MARLLLFKKVIKLLMQDLLSEPILEFIKESMEILRKKSLKTHFFLVLILSILYSGCIVWGTGLENCNNYRTSLVISTNSWVEYTIESIGNGAVIHSGVLPPRKGVHKRH